MENFFDLKTLDIVLRLVVAMFCGMVLGTERTLAHKTAGMRTYALVAMGAALFVSISEYLLISFGDQYGIDPLRMASQVVAGVGFLGAGIIFMKDNQITGVTTASSIWVAAGIGIACGFGLFEIAIYATLLTLFVFVVLYWIEQKSRKLPVYNNGNSSDIKE